MLAALAPSPTGPAVAAAAIGSDEPTATADGFALLLALLAGQPLALPAAPAASTDATPVGAAGPGIARAPAGPPLPALDGAHTPLRAGSVMPPWPGSGVPGVAAAGRAPGTQILEAPAGGPASVLPQTPQPNGLAIPPAANDHAPPSLLLSAVDRPGEPLLGGSPTAAGPTATVRAGSEFLAPSPAPADDLPPPAGATAGAPPVPVQPDRRGLVGGRAEEGAPAGVTALGAPRPRSTGQPPVETGAAPLATPTAADPTPAALDGAARAGDAEVTAAPVAIAAVEVQKDSAARGQPAPGSPRGADGVRPSEPASAEPPVGAETAQTGSEPGLALDPAGGPGAPAGRTAVEPTGNPRPGPQPLLQPPTIQIAAAIAQRAGTPVNGLHLRLEPAELGSVEITVTAADRRKARAVVLVERPETLELLQREQRTLERILATSGLQLQGGGVELGLRQEGGRHQGGLDPRTAPGRAEGGAPSEPAQTPARVLSIRLLDLVI